MIDTSALMQAYLIDTYTDHVKALLSRLADEDPPEIAFLSIGLAECANVVWKRVSFGGLGPTIAHRILNNIKALPIAIYQIDPLINDGLSSALAQNIAVYDALFIALTLRVDAGLVTADQKQAQAAKLLGARQVDWNDLSISTD